MTNEELFKHKNNPKVREQIIMKNMPLVKSLAWKFSKNKDIYNDLVSEGEIVLCRCVDKFDSNRGSKFSSFLYPSLKNAYIKYMKECRERYENEQCFSNISIDYNYDPEANEGSLNVDEEILEKLRVELKNLNEKEQYILRHYYGLYGENMESLQELATDWGCSRESIRMYKRRTLEKLREKIKDI